MRATDIIGRAGGVLLAPIAAAGSMLRRSRLFHPEGVVYRADVAPIANAEPARAVAERLAGPAIVRISNAWWKGGKERPDVLGVAVRFRRSPAVEATADDGDQDLLFATVRRWWTTPFAPLATNPHSFLWNDYHAVSPFDVAGFGRAKLRLVSPHLDSRGERREAALQRAVRDDRAVFQLEARRTGFGTRFVPIATLRLLERVSLDQEALRFQPFRAGRAIVPRGVVNGLRLAVYRAGQRARARVRAALPATPTRTVHVNTMPRERGRRPEA